MTWLAELPAEGTDWDRAVAVWPEAFAAMSRLVAAAWTDVDPVLLELCRLRVASLLGYASEGARRSDRARSAGLTEGKLAELSSWPVSDQFTSKERACLALAEQFVMDAKSITDAHVAEVLEHLGPDGCYAFVQALSVLETFQRACLTLGIESTPPVDVIAQASGGGRAPGGVRS